MNKINSLVRRQTFRTKRNLDIKWLNANDPLIPTIVDFLREHFHPAEPLNQSIELMKHPQDVKTLDALYRSSFPHGASVAALDENGNLVGVLLNDVLKRHPDKANKHEFHDADWNPTPRYAKFLDLIPKLVDDMMLFKKYPNVENILDHTILSVSEDWQGDGISQILIEYTNKVIAKELKCGLSFVICSSFYSAKVFEKSGYKEIWSKKFRDYVEDGEVLFPTEAPHNYITCKLLEFE